MSILKISLKKEIDINMSLTIREKKTAYKARLSVDEDTSFERDSILSTFNKYALKII